MENVIHVGNKIDKESADNMAGAIVDIFKAAHETRMEQKTVIKALQSLTSAMEVKNVSISHSSFTGDKIVNMDKEE